MYVTASNVTANDQVTVSDSLVSADIYTSNIYALDSVSDQVITVTTSDVTVAADLTVTSDLTANFVYQVNPTNSPSTYMLVPPGCIFPYAATSAPAGYLLCNGAAVSRVTYANLFAIISTTYGVGNASTTFNLPNLVNRFIYGSTGVGTIGGSNTATLTTANMPAHSHTATVSTDGVHSHTVGIGKDDGNLSNSTNPNQYPPGDADAPNYYINSGDAGAHSHTVSISTDGGGEAFSIMNPYMTMLYIIKY